MTLTPLAIFLLLYRMYTSNHPQISITMPIFSTSHSTWADSKARKGNKGYIYHTVRRARSSSVQSSRRLKYLPLIVSCTILSFYYVFSSQYINCYITQKYQPPKFQFSYPSVQMKLLFSFVVHYEINKRDMANRLISSRPVPALVHKKRETKMLFISSSSQRFPSNLISLYYLYSIAFSMEINIILGIFDGFEGWFVVSIDFILNFPAKRPVTFERLPAKYAEI